MALNAYFGVVWAVEKHLRVRPLLLFAVILVILGIQFISIGLLAALIHAPQSRGRSYPVRLRLPAAAEAKTAAKAQAKTEVATRTGAGADALAPPRRLIRHEED